MRDWDNNVRSRAQQRAGSGKRPLVVRHTDDDDQEVEVLSRLARLGSLSESAGNALIMSRDSGPLARFDTKTIVALGAIFLSIAGYIIEDARNTSRQQVEIEAMKVRVTNLERIASANTESRIRSEVELGDLRQGQAEIKEMLRAHENETLRILGKK